jgi:hypothetical protein
VAVIDGAAPERWDRDALRAGAIVALVFAVPLSIGARWAADSRDDSTLALWMSLGAVIGFRCPARRAGSRSG